MTTESNESKHPSERRPEDELVLIRRDPPVRRRGRNPVMTEMFDLHVEMLQRSPDEWFVVRHEVAKGRTAARPFHERGCLTQIHPAEGTPGLFDVYACWPSDRSQVFKRLSRQVVEPGSSTL